MWPRFAGHVAVHSCWGRGCPQHCLPSLSGENNLGAKKKAREMGAWRQGGP